MAQASKAEFLTDLSKVPWIQENQELLGVLNKVIELVKGTKPPPVIEGLTAELGSTVVSKIPPPIPAPAGQGVGGLTERFLGQARIETVSGAKVDEGLGNALVGIRAIPATGAKFARLAQDELIKLVPAAFATEAGAKAATVAEAQRVLNELMKIKHWQQVLNNKNVLVVIGDAEEVAEVAIIGGKAGILQGHHTIEKSMVKLLKRPIPGFGFTTLDEALVPFKGLTRTDHIGKSGLHLKMWYVWEDGVRTSTKTMLHPSRLKEFGNAQDMMDALIDFYDANEEYRELAKITRVYCRANGLPFTK